MLRFRVGGAYFLASVPGRLLDAAQFQIAVPVELRIDAVRQLVIFQK